MPTVSMPVQVVAGLTVANIALFAYSLVSMRGGASHPDVAFARGFPAGTSGSLDSAGSGECWRSQLARAESIYQRNQKRRAVLVGTEEEQTIPLTGAAQTAFQAVRNEAWQSVYLSEYMLFPRYPCLEEERVGMWGEGGKWVCLQGLHKQPENIVVYSIGSIGDSTFEEGMFKLLGVTSLTFDPFLRPELVAEMRKLPYLKFHDFGLAAAEETSVSDEQGRVGKAKGIHTMMSEFGHKFVDVFKIDCEGCENKFVAHLAATTKRTEPIFGLILMEIHNAQDFQVESPLFKRLHDLGYRLYHLEPNFFAIGKCWEVAFIHESLC